MKKLVFALLTTCLMGSAFAQTAATNNPDHRKAAELQKSSTASVPGAKKATVQSLGELKPYGVVLGVVAVGAIVAVSSSGGHHNTSGTTGTVP